MKRKYQAMDIQHFIVFNRLVTGGYLRSMSHSSLKAYLAIKVFTTTEYQWSDDEEPRLLAILEEPTYPPYSKIREMTGLSRQTIAKAIAELNDLRLFSYERGNSFKKANFYQLNPPQKWIELDQLVDQSKTKTRLERSNTQTHSGSRARAKPVGKGDMNKFGSSNGTNTYVPIPNTNTHVPSIAVEVSPAHPQSAGVLESQRELELPEKSDGAKLWERVTELGKRGDLDPLRVSRKFAVRGYSCDLASKILLQIESGDFTWFDDLSSPAYDPPPIPEGYGAAPY